MSAKRTIKEGNSPSFPTQQQRTSDVFGALLLTAQLENALSSHLESEGSQVHLTVVLGSNPATPIELSKDEMSKFETLSSTPRCPSWLTGRAVLKGLLKRCGLSQDTSSLQFPNKSFSLSHSGEVAIAVQAKLAQQQDTPGPALVGTGIDLELDRSVNPKAMKFFLQPGEISTLLQAGDNVLEKNLLRLWTVKEALFKADSNNSNTFPGEYILSTPLDHTGWASHRHRKDIRFLYSSVVCQFGIVTLALALAPQVLQQ